MWSDLDTIQTNTCYDVGYIILEPAYIDKQMLLNEKWLVLVFSYVYKRLAFTKYAQLLTLCKMAVVTWRNV